MGVIRLTDISGINLKTNPLNTNGELLRAVNVDPYHIGSWRKRPGYSEYLTNVDGGSVSCLFSWLKDDGTTLFMYRISGGTLYYSAQGTGAWTVAGNGTFSPGAFTHPGTLENTLILGDGTTATRHTTDGTSFTDTVAAPKGNYFADYQNRIYMIGTQSFGFYSNVGTPTDWINDSTSITIPGGGKLNACFKVSDRLAFTKNSGIAHRWDGDSLVDIVTNLGPSSPQSISSIEDYSFYLNRYGEFGFGGGKPEIISNKVEKQIYNNSGNGIAGNMFDVAYGHAHKYDYLLSVGSISEDITNEPINNACLVYNYQLNNHRNYSLGTMATAFESYTDANGNSQLVFGDASGKCYQFSGTLMTDNGQAINAVLEGFIHGGSFLEKKYNWFRALFNPGCQASVQICITDTFTKQAKTWITLGSAKDGVVEYHFPSDSRGRFLFFKISDSSTSSPFEFYGIEVDADLIQR